jgi:hypothetical protein
VNSVSFNSSSRRRPRFFKSRGPLNVLRSLQHGPAILQAGTSGKGRGFAARYAEYNTLVPLEDGLAISSGHLDFDLSTLPLDTIMAHRTEPKLQRMQTRSRSKTGELLTLKQVAQNHGQAAAAPRPRPRPLSPRVCRMDPSRPARPR